MSAKSPFEVGQRVRMRPTARLRHPNMKSFTGVVTRVRHVHAGSDVYWVTIRRDGMRTNTTHPAQSWEPPPLADLTLDQTAQDLADAVKRGDTTAALALVARLVAEPTLTTAEARRELGLPADVVETRAREVVAEARKRLVESEV